MTTSPSTVVLRALIFFFGSTSLLLLPGCAPKGETASKAADAYFATGSYDRAEIEYKNALQAQKKPDAHAIGRLGEIYFSQGRIRPAYAYLQKAVELQPDNFSARIKLAQVFLLARKFPEARAQAEYVLSRRPEDPDAPVILIQGSLSSVTDVKAAQGRLNQLPPKVVGTAPVLTGLAMAELIQKNYVGSEEILKRALAVDPTFVGAHSTLAASYRSQGKKAEAELSLKSAADLAPPRSGDALQYAQFKLQNSDSKGARELLDGLAAKAPDYLPAQVLLAEILAGEKKLDDASGLVTKILTREPEHLEATLLGARLRLAKADPAGAAEQLERLLKVYPNHPQALYFLGLSYVATGEMLKAVDRLRSAVKIAPMPEAILALASANLRTGDYSGAMLALQPFVAKYPQNVTARNLLAAAFRGQGKMDEAVALYNRSEKDFANDPQPSFQKALTFLSQKQVAEARISFEEALRRDASFLPALEQLVILDSAEKRYDAALQRIEPQLARNPNSAPLHLLIGEINALKGKTTEAEAAYKRSIELRPDVPTSYFKLAQLYVRTHQEEKALSSLKSSIERNPKDSTALLLTALLHEQRKDYASAREAYEKVVLLNPKSLVALNNLANLYSEKFQEPEKAHEAAQKAHELQPDEPHATDTLGWILYKKQNYSRALTLLEDAAEKLPNSSEVSYHLGSARYMLGLEEDAKAAFDRSLQLDSATAFVPEIQQRLSVLGINAETPVLAATAILEKAGKDDVVALIKLGQVQERAGATDKALDTYRNASRANPTSPAPLVAIARIHTARKETQLALEAARSARRLANDDPELARTLAPIAAQLSDDVWAASLYQEATRRLSADSELLTQAALATYRVGQVEAARDLAGQAVGSAEPATNAIFKARDAAPVSAVDRARQFLALTSWVEKPDGADERLITSALESDPTSLPAMMASAALDEAQGNVLPARKTYENILSRAGQFSPAKLRLALIASSEERIDSGALELAQQARAAFPENPQAAKALGIITVRQNGDAARAVTLLKQSVSANPDDARAQFYLGVAQLQTKDTSAARRSLENALRIGLPADLAAAAKKSLESK
jgi:tetratricopeptide (TPR) repeat protein